ncbi:hypothetical protein PR202_ga08843 [Eleusine coracana subsp. coracana]|uniref:ENTH domain-containing protein n=1 Tax=Eleusine coracana subsp. coracana TaxID=191504 RepID=A0AAV5C2C8_ELECO|nr:hypothetical protein QOZ80_1AG0042080 [Eleusine coracana subsp. coracana]GJM92372.1 hypothetical protein PR202_ga08843 [Eleusine coracana subsp. coracana]
MAPNKLREALGAAKDKTTIGLARARSADDVSADLEAAIVKATAHGEALYPADVEAHVQEILTLTRYSRARVSACAATVSRRLGRTRAWPVALRALALAHGLLVEGDPAFEPELFLALASARRRVLDDVASRFGARARAGSSAWDFAAFVRAYAAYLDDRLKLRAQQGSTSSSPRQNCRLDDDSFHDANEEWDLVSWEKQKQPVVTETATGDLVARAQQLARLLDRATDCRPVGRARTRPAVTAAVRAVVMESAATYCELTEVAAALVDRFADLDTPGCVRVHAAFTSLARTVDEFYCWCTASAVCRPCDVPEVERVRQKKLDLMEEFIRDRLVSSRRSQSAPAPLLSPTRPRVDENDVQAETEQAIGDHEFVVSAHHKKNSGNDALSLVDDDNMADFLNLNEGEGTSPQPCSNDHAQNLSLTLLDGDSAEQAPKWAAFEDDPFVADREAAPVQSLASRLASQHATLGGGFNAMTGLNGVYSYPVANNASATSNALGFAGSANSVATRTPSMTLLALPAPPSGADPFAASLAVPPPTYVQMMDLQTRQRLLVEEQMVWQQCGRQRPAWNHHNHLL